ncbi:hypothetical protein FA048_05875 [Pedobacter polaris]|uniref:Outer membrane protein beta-barrel domain-containing protein n=1 Tax=Pedobacter polaris TaxID=2571273 RepID=A0A4U1CXL4_9SPHI|nr:hypothetical protein [Pedobacter polaris]TKC13140.1 hypothetical protein FA048_05875 [Pedobacter polaris]
MAHQYIKGCLFTLLTFTAIMVFGQDSLSVNNVSRPGYKKWTNSKSSLRFGLGVQKTFFAEVGLSRHKYLYNDLGYASKAYYTSVEWVPKFSNANNHIYGIKAGYELNARILALGLEAKYQTDFKDNDIILTPKIGVGVMGVLNLFYGYNISTNKSPFPYIRHHQFSIVCNFNNEFFKNAKSK